MTMQVPNLQLKKEWIASLWCCTEFFWHQKRPKNDAAFFVVFAPPTKIKRLKGRDNVMLFNWNNQKIAMAHVLPSDVSKANNTSSLTLTSNEQEIEGAIKEADSFFLILMK